MNVSVVVDKKANKNASTGQWELVYRQNYSPSFATVDLDVKGKKIARVPTPLKIEFGNNPNSSTTDRKRGDNPDQNYEIIKCLNDAKNDDGKKLEAFRKDSEKYKYNKSTQSAQMLLKKVTENEGSSKIGNRSLTFGKPKFKETRESSAKLPTGKDDKQHVENFDFRYEKLKSKNSRSEDEVNKFKFSKFYKL